LYVHRAVRTFNQLKEGELTMTNNRYNLTEWAGAFGDLGVFIPLVVGYITIMGLDPLGILVIFGVSLIGTGVYFRTPIPVQPMKVIAAVAIVQVAFITPNMIWGAGLFTGIFWIALGMSGLLKRLGKIVTKPVILGLVLGIGISLMFQGITFMRTSIVIGIVALVITFLLLRIKKVPALLVLLLFGIIIALVESPELWQELRGIQPGLRMPTFALSTFRLSDLGWGILLLAIPQIPLTLGGAIISTTAQNNKLFPDRPVTEKKLAISLGLVNTLSPIFGGVPMGHGVGGMLTHTRFGAKTGGATIILGSTFLLLGLFFSDSVLLLFGLIPTSILGVILFLAGAEIALMSRDIGREKKNIIVLVITAGFSLWNIAIGFAVGLVVQELVKRLDKRKGEEL
jgi:MFS superfamily sulfate permease-like transporter